MCWLLNWPVPWPLTKQTVWTVLRAPWALCTLQRSSRTPISAAQYIMCCLSHCKRIARKVYQRQCNCNHEGQRRTRTDTVPRLMITGLSKAYPASPAEPREGSSVKSRCAVMRTCWTESWKAWASSSTVATRRLAFCENTVQKLCVKSRATKRAVRTSQRRQSGTMLHSSATAEQLRRVKPKKTSPISE